MPVVTSLNCLKHPDYLVDSLISIEKWIYRELEREYGIEVIFNQNDDLIFRYKNLKYNIYEKEYIRKKGD